MEFCCLRDHAAHLGRASRWFAEKWNIPAAIYQESMMDCCQKKSGIPQWYVVLDGQRDIIAGAGVIENDFHERTDLKPNLCALFVEETHRGKGIARYILDYARKDLGRMGFEWLYLVTDHTEFYEKCGWEFLLMVRGADGAMERMYAAKTL